MIKKAASILDQYFTPQTMSVHIQQDQALVSKQGKPGAWELIKQDTKRKPADVRKLRATIEQEVEKRDDAWIEIQRSASQVLQLGTYRIVIVEPPVANTLEITIVRPIAKLDLQDYALDEHIQDRILNKAQGILIAGSPGEGKTTFAQAIIDRIALEDIIIKTIESPRDLQVPEGVTQYSFSHAPHDEIRDILLLSRPDRSIYDEVRNREDFHLYKDLRLTGIGLIGVMHATHAVDAIQRFIGAVDMGTVPQVIDTIIFIKAGQVEQVLTLEQVVKTPIGMNSDDLARPVILVSSLPDNEPRYEIYSYGDNVVVMPLDQVRSGQDPQATSPVHKYAEQAIADKLQELIQHRAHVQVTGPGSVTMYIPDSIKGRVIGRNGARIDEIQKTTGLSISVRSMGEIPGGIGGGSGGDIPFTVNDVSRGKKKKIEIQFPEKRKHKDIRILIGDDLHTYTINHNSIVTIRRGKHVERILQGDISVLAS